MDFWNTVLGNNLAQVLIYTLPKLAEKKQQYGTVVSNDEVVDYIDKRLQAGERFVTSFPKGEDATYIIMEEE